MPWLAECERAKERHRQQADVLHELTLLFDKAGIGCRVLKGERLARLYPNAELREYSDIDLYFGSEHKRADNLVRERLHADISDDGTHHTKFDYRGVTVESHYRLLNPYYPRSNRRCEEQLLAMSDTPTFEAAYLLRHLAVHFAAQGLALRDLADWHLAIHAEGADTDAVAQLAEASGMTGFLATMQTVDERIFGSQSYSLPASADGIAAEAAADRIMREALSFRGHEGDGLGRLAWKLRRWHKGRWRRRLAYSESDAALALQSLSAHLRAPRSIIQKQ